MIWTIISLVSLVISLCMLGFWAFMRARQELQIRRYKRLREKLEAK